MHIVRERKKNNNSVGVSLDDYPSSYMLYIFSYLLSTKQDEAATTTTTTAAAALWEFAVHLVETLTILHVEVALLRSNTTVLVYHH